MLKRLNQFVIVFTLGATLLYTGVPAASAGSRSKPKHPAHTQDTDASTNTPDAATLPATPATQNAAAAANSQPQPAPEKIASAPAPVAQPLQVQAELQKDWRDRLSWDLCAALVLIAFAALLFVRKSLKTVETLLGELKSVSGRAERTIDHVGRQSEAALLIAKSAARVDRSWIVVSVESPERDRYLFRARNVGKTPARITSLNKFNSAVNTGKKFKIAPEYERPEGQISIQPFFLPPTASCIIFDYTMKELGVGNASDVENKLAAIYTYGRVLYCDAADTTSVHETRWFYIKLPGEASLPFPDPMHPEFNNYA